MKNQLFIVIPNYNGARFLPQCLDSLSKQTVDCTVVVVDNGSHDSSRAIVTTKYPDVHLIKLDFNMGFAGGVNKGIEYILENHKPKYIALFNNDAEAEPDWLEHLVDRIEQEPTTGIATGKLMRYEGQVFDSTGESYTDWGLPYPRGRDVLDEGQYDIADEVFGATGGASLYRAEMLRQIGLFDMNFFAYYEDVDISFRAQARGWRVWYEPKAMAYHRVGSTSKHMGNFTLHHTLKNFWYLWMGNMPTSLALRYAPTFFFGSLLLFASCVRRGRFITIFGAWRAIGNSVGYVRRKRSDNLKAQTVSNDYLASIITHRLPTGLKNFRRLLRLLRIISKKKR